MTQEITSIYVESLPDKLDWIKNPINFTYESDALYIQSRPETDMFIDPNRLGFSSQSPTGEGCAVIFSDIKFEDLRNGS